MPRSVYFLVPPGVNSFYYAAYYASRWLDPSLYQPLIVGGRYFALGRPRIVVNDMWQVALRPSSAEVWWVDTPLDYTDRYSGRWDRYVGKVWTTSTWNLEMCMRYHSRCSLMPRLPHPVYVAESYDALKTEKIWDIAFVGARWPRKNWGLFMGLVDKLGLKAWWTASYKAMDLNELVKRLKRTKILWWVTGSEGFGLPLIEAQLLGVVPLAVWGHANVDWCLFCQLAKEYVVEPSGVELVEYSTGRVRAWTVEAAEVEEKLRMLLRDYDALADVRDAMVRSARRMVAYYARELNERLKALV